MLLLCGECLEPLVLVAEKPICTLCLYRNAKLPTTSFPTFAKPEWDGPPGHPLWERWEAPEVEEE